VHLHIRRFRRDIMEDYISRKHGVDGWLLQGLWCGLTSLVIAVILAEYWEIFMPRRLFNYSNFSWPKKCGIKRL